jgi:N-acetylmuramoyl-L-alanine amidase
MWFAWLSVARMLDRYIRLLVIHCSASANGVSLARDGKTAVQVIDDWHHSRGFARDADWRSRFNPDLRSVGYHYVINTDGMSETARHRNERGAHVQGSNFNSLGICMIGTDKFTLAQWDTLHSIIKSLLIIYPNCRICGHRDLSVDINRDGRVTPNEWSKTCPGFDVTDWWLSKNFAPMQGHIFDEVTHERN